MVSVRNDGDGGAVTELLPDQKGALEPGEAAAEDDDFRSIGGRGGPPSLTVDNAMTVAHQVRRRIRVAPSKGRG
jgi:hypothetical protein